MLCVSKSVTVFALLATTALSSADVVQSYRYNKSDGTFDYWWTMEEGPPTGVTTMLEFNIGAAGVASIDPGSLRTGQLGVTVAIKPPDKIKMTRAGGLQNGDSIHATSVEHPSALLSPFNPYQYTSVAGVTGTGTTSFQIMGGARISLTSSLSVGATLISGTSEPEGVLSIFQNENIVTDALTGIDSILIAEVVVGADGLFEAPLLATLTGERVFIGVATSVGIEFGDIVFTAIPVPAPGTAVLLASGSLVIAGRRRR